MKKLMFFDYRELEHVEGFSRAVESPVKHPDAPLMTPDLPWEHGNMQLYGSVIQAADGRFRAWYEMWAPPRIARLAYAESDDGLVWRKPRLDAYRHDGRPTNIVFDAGQTGAALIDDREDHRPAWRYKMLTGAAPTDCIAALHSADGIHWNPVRTIAGRIQPVIATNPDCPIGCLRAPDGRFVAYHRMDGYGRRVFRSESWDFVNWSGEPRMVLEPRCRRPAADAVLRPGRLRLRAVRSGHAVDLCHRNRGPGPVQNARAADAGIGLCAGRHGLAPSRTGDAVHSQRRPGRVGLRQFAASLAAGLPGRRDSLLLRRDQRTARHGLGAGAAGGRAGHGAAEAGPVRGGAGGARRTAELGTICVQAAIGGGVRQRAHGGRMARCGWNCRTRRRGRCGGSRRRTAGRLRAIRDVAPGGVAGRWAG